MESNALRYTFESRAEISIVVSCCRGALAAEEAIYFVILSEAKNLSSV
jgi:hypothetical protein